MTIKSKHNRVITVAGEITKTIVTLAIYAFIIAAVLGGLVALAILGGEMVHDLCMLRAADR